MKIVHICISVPYVDSWGYQENLLPAYLQKAGAQNYVIASANNFPVYLKEDAREAILKKGSSYSIDGVQIRRIHTKRISTSLYLCNGLKAVLNDIKPDAIFHHNFNCTSMVTAMRYAKKNHIPLLVDNHADTINMTRNRLWRLLYYKVLTGGACLLYGKRIFKAYGVTHARCDFIKDFFGLPSDKINFLPIGADVDTADTLASKLDLREKYGFEQNSFVVVSGGKMGVDKGTDNLIDAVRELSADYPHLRLVLFGVIEDDETASKAASDKNTTLFGWCDRQKTLELLKMADIACWPIHHTTLIEDAVSVGTPFINRKTATSEHLIDGNGAWLQTGSKEEIKEAVKVYLDTEDMAAVEQACEKMKDRISYKTIALRVLEDIALY